MRKTKIIVLVTVISALVGACAAPNQDAVNELTDYGKEDVTDMTQEAFDQTYVKQEGIDVIYLAGGCFWGLEKLMQSIPGVVNVVSGYANGNTDVVPTYTKVTMGDTEYRETVRVEYNPTEVSLDALLFAYFMVIDPTIENAQGNDIGTQYQTGVYYVDDTSRATVERITEIESARNEKFVVEIEALERFYDAEDYHQDYLTKNPTGYCHISQSEILVAGEMIVDPVNYPRPAEDQIESMLTDLQYAVTQENSTEPAFNNVYWDNHEKGIYIDVVTGEPLFSSRDKFDSGTGWPSFTNPIDENAIRLLDDSSFGMLRIEVRSRAGNSHLGHIFYDDPISPTGTRYCINSAALRFIPYEEMTNEGYAYLLEYVE